VESAVLPVTMPDVMPTEFGVELPPMFPMVLRSVPGAVFRVALYVVPAAGLLPVFRRRQECTAGLTGDNGNSERYRSD